MVKIQSSRHKIKRFYTPVICQSIRAKKQPALYREKCGQFQNPNIIEHFVKSTKNQLEKSEKEKMKMSDKLYNMHRKIFCVNFRFMNFY